MSLDVQGIGSAMIDAARASAATRWPKLHLLAETELPKLAQSLADVANQLAEGKIVEAHARQLVHMHQISARQVLQTIEGIALLTAEQAIQAGIRAVAKAVNGAAKVTLV